MKEYLIYFAQAYANFRQAELESLAHFYGFHISMSHHDPSSPFLIVQLENDRQAQQLVERSILARGVFELWGHGDCLEELHHDVLENSQDRFEKHKHRSFKFDFIGYMGSRSKKERWEIIESFSYLNFEGPVKMSNPEDVFTVLEEYRVEGREKAEAPLHMWFGRTVQMSARTNNIIDTYDLRRRKYIGTTSFDAELSLVSCNIAQIGSHKVVYDPFAGTGSFMVAAAHFGGFVLGSDIDVRMLRGKGESNIHRNFQQYGTLTNYLDVLAMDFTNNSLRRSFQVDSIVCDPPYGVREGLRVCGARNPERAAGKENLIIDGEKAHLRRDFIPPKKPYQLGELLHDLLQFAAERLPINGRLAFWMPTTNEDSQEHDIPMHQNLQLLYCLNQDFNKWSRRLMVYSKCEKASQVSSSADLSKISNFRNLYFNSFLNEIR